MGKMGADRTSKPRRGAAKSGSSSRAARNRNASSRPITKRERRMLAAAGGGIALVLLIVLLMVFKPSSPFRTRSLAIKPGAAKGWNVLLVTLEATRSDRLGCYGYAGGLTPSLDELARTGTRFADVVTAVPLSLPAHASLMTGSYPPRHGVRGNGTYRLDAAQVTLAETLGGAGYRTAAFTGAFLLDRRYGLAQGFDEYDDRFGGMSVTAGRASLNPERRADRVVEAALGWLGRSNAPAGGKPFFAWVHLNDPDVPYASPQPYASAYAARPYDGELAFTDRELGRLFAGLDSLGLRRRTLVVVTGTAGQGLGDHGESLHGLLLHESTVRVPLLVNAPGLVKPGVVADDRVVSIVDLAPTILDAVGIDPGKGDGRSLLRPASPDRGLYMETLGPSLHHGWSPLFALRRGTLKYIASPAPQLFDVALDPGEKQNLVATRAADASALRDELARLLAAMPGGTALPVPGDGSPDPAAMIAGSDEQMRVASQLVNERRAGEAIPAITRMLAGSPRDASLWSMLSTAQSQAGQIDDAIRSRQTAIRFQPGDANAWVLLARLQDQKGDAAGCDASLAEAERIEPELGAIHMLRAIRAMRGGRDEDALALAREAARRDPTRFGADAWGLQGEILRSLGREAEAAAAFDSANAASTR